MIIYYHCTSNNPLLLSFTNLPSIHPLSFHERIFYTCSTRRAAKNENDHAFKTTSNVLTSVEVSLEL